MVWYHIWCWERQTQRSAEKELMFLNWGSGRLLRVRTVKDQTNNPAKSVLTIIEDSMLKSSFQNLATDGKELKHWKTPDAGNIEGGEVVREMRCWYTINWLNGELSIPELAVSEALQCRARIKVTEAGTWLKWTGTENLTALKEATVHYKM